jgi:acetylornithine/N-succinyldiaminopimelate aminotransferase
MCCKHTHEIMLILSMASMQHCLMKRKRLYRFYQWNWCGKCGAWKSALSRCYSEQARHLIHTSNLAIEPQAKLAKKINELTGFDVAVFFGNSGAEANEGAIKLARKYGEKKFANKKYKVLTLEHSFHGRTITTVKATGQESFHKSYFAPYPEGFSYSKAIDDLYHAIDDETVAVMIELVQGEGGVKAFPKQDIQDLAQHF